MAKHSVRTFSREEAASPVSSGLRSLAGLSLAVAGSWILYSHLAIDHQMALPEALPAERKIFQSQAAGSLSFYQDRSGEGRPLALGVGDDDRIPVGEELTEHRQFDKFHLD